MRGCAHDPRTWAEMSPEQCDAAKREIRIFKVFLGHSSTPAGIEHMKQHRFWRRYMGLEQ